MLQARGPQPAPAGWRDHICTGLLYYYLTSLIPLLAVAFGHHYLRPLHAPPDAPADLPAAFANWDGRWYAHIMTQGYSYDPENRSDVAFFPAFPLLAAALARATGLRDELALLLVAHACLAASFVVLAAYVRRRYPAADLAPWALLAFGLWPTTLFFRMAYSESLFLLACLLALYGMSARWPAPLLALVIGLATATRPVGVALLAPLLLHLRDTSPSWTAAGRRFLLLAPPACWGLLAYMAYQGWAFGDALAFARTQEHWRVRPAAPLGERFVSLLTLEPLWGVLDPSSPCHWATHEPAGSPLFSLHLANPIYFVVTIALLAVGARARWLDRLEVSLGAGLLLIPYLTRGHEMCLGAMGRFTAVVVPVYLVLGNLLARLPPPLAAALLCLSGFFLGAYAALFAAWHRVF